MVAQKVLLIMAVRSWRSSLAPIALPTMASIA
ncbi:Uncharacterised protein [Vibrio cholerae]|nr:Uncharacterised protein [Vibrio cholerae]